MMANTTLVRHVEPGNRTVTMAKAFKLPHPVMDSQRWGMCPYCGTTVEARYTGCLTCGGHFKE